MSEPTSMTAEERLHKEEEEERAKAKKGKRKYRRGKRESEGEIKELNITAMMDMMTILLVFLLKSYTASSGAVNLTEDLKLPNSSTTQGTQDNIDITITASVVTVGDKAACPVVEGTIPSDYRKRNGLLVTPVFEALQVEVEKQKYIAQFNKARPFRGVANIVADRRTPYHTILEVMYTAGQVELGQFKLLALKAAE
jgi:biopolymer transport protein ExbD